MNDLDFAAPRPPGEVDNDPHNHRGFDYCRECGYPGVGSWILTWENGTIQRKCPNCLADQIEGGSHDET